ncbi:RNA polymerase sigma-70 factor, ECF subfamily [Tenacibaculum sp. MAR_2009_124]|uniref:RNA polymerase sigma-70 factor n=1 Tax=Tenacibaculum sp. MAR_2009_124 TaxID=1250059 RepID=UPI00089B5B15|nr:RNA polymerase sigma-70 factor [Tenacibaculum sp. MAR_2009_124]SEB74763.1 RNA polymerase sigma-70 factor, ECF subfamily [Tenacibaculum sp. MAR_2009_124]
MGDNLLINRLNIGDAEDSKTIFNLYYPRLLFFAKSYVKHHEDAEELVQDVFVKLFSKKEPIKVKKNLNGLLFTMTRNSCLDFLRRKKRTLYIDDNILQKEYAINYKAIGDDDSMRMIEEELEDQIRIAIELLPEKCRNVFVKSRFEGAKNREISEDLNISIKTVENHITRALKHMKERLGDYLYFF